MATPIADNLKKALMDRGLWGDFIRRREDIREETGVGSMRANRAALREFVEAGKVPESFLDAVKGRGRPKKLETVSVAPVAKRSASTGALADVRRANRDAREDGGVGSSNGAAAASVSSAASVAASVAPVTKEMFAGRSCSFLKSFLWAYENIRFADAKPEDAPSAIAWNLMLDMRASPSLKADLSRAALTKSIAKSDEDDGGTAKFDGEAEYDLLGVLSRGGAD